MGDHKHNPNVGQAPQRMVLQVLQLKDDIGILPNSNVRFIVNQATGMIDVALVGTLVRVSKLEGGSKAFDLPLRIIWRLPIAEALQTLEQAETQQKQETTKLLESG